MRKSHSRCVTVDVEGVEVTLLASYSYTPGCPEQGPSYDSGGQPAEGPEIEITSMKVKGEEVPQWFFDAVIAGESVPDYIRDNHEDDDGRDE